MVKDEYDSSHVTSSSDSDVEPPKQKKARPNASNPSGKPRGNRKGPERSSTQELVETKLCAIAEESGEMEIETSE